VTKLTSPYMLIAILVLSLLLAALRLNGHLVPAGDNATYIVLAQALGTRQGYRMISDPRMPAMALYPPGYPSLLTAVLWLTGTTHDLLAAIVPMKLVSIALYLGAIAVAYDLFRRRDARLGALTALLMAVSPELLYFANEVGTEIPYLFLSLGCIWLFERYLRESRPRFVWLVCAALAVTFYVRSIALVLIIACGLRLVVQGRLKEALLLLLCVGVLIAPWFIYSSSLPDTGTSVGLGRGYFALYFSSDPYGTATVGLGDLLGRFHQNLRIYGLDIWPDTILPHASSVAKLLGPLGEVFLAAMSALLLAGFVLEARHGHATESYVLLFFASCVGYLWAQGRLIVPIIPFAIYYFLVAVRALLRWAVRGTQWQLAMALVALVLASSALVGDVRHIERNLRYGLGQPVDVYYARDAEWNNYLRAMRWIDSDAGQAEVVMCRKADLMYILTGHRALEYPYSADRKELMRAVYNNQVAYVIEDAFTWTRTTEQYLQPALRDWQAADPSALALTYETTAPHTRVWRIKQS
jgi:hypothetical protein